MSKKYRVEQDGQFLGHWVAHTPHEAVMKMMKSSYANCYKVDTNGEFLVTKNDKPETIQL